MRDLSEEEEVEIRAKESGLSYVKLDGNIGCLVNGLDWLWQQWM